MMSDDMIRMVFTQIDTSQDGLICIDEFEQWLLQDVPEPGAASDDNDQLASDEGEEMGDAKADGEEKEASALNSEDGEVDPGSPQQAEPEPSPTKGEFQQALVKSAQKGGPVLSIKIVILPARSQGKRAFIDRSVQRLYSRHAETQEKLDMKKKAAEKQIAKKASPDLKPTPEKKISEYMPKVEGGTLEFYQRLYADAHRRHVDKRIKVKESLRELKIAQDKDS